MTCADGNASEQSNRSVATPPARTKTRYSATSDQVCKRRTLTHAKAFATKVVMDNMDIVIAN